MRYWAEGVWQLLGSWLHWVAYPRVAQRPIRCSGAVGQVSELNSSAALLNIDEFWCLLVLIGVL